MIILRSVPLLALLLSAAMTAAAHAQPSSGPSPSPADLDPLDFGADPTGREDSSPAFAKLMAEAGQNRQIRIRIPPGRFRLAQRVVLEAAGNASNYGMRIEGAGEDATELLVDNSEGGIFFRGKNISFMTFSIANLSFVAWQPDAGTALEFEIPNPGDQRARQFNAENLLIRGERFDRGSFRDGVVVRNAWYPRLSNVKVAAQHPGKRTPEERVRHRDLLEHAFLLEDCYSPIVDSCYAWGGNHGLVHRAVRTQPEDGIISKSYFVGNITGLTLDLKSDAKQWAEPGFHIDNCHINYVDTGILVKGVRQMNISHCLFYCSDRSGAAFFKGKNGPARDFEPADIDFVHGSDAMIKGNIFTEPSNPKRVAVRLSEDAGYVLIAANQFNFDGTAIVNRSRLPNFSADNIFGGSPDFSEGIRPYRDKSRTLQTRDFEPRRR